MKRVIILVLPTDWSPRNTSLYLAMGWTVACNDVALAVALVALAAADFSSVLGFVLATGCCCSVETSPSPPSSLPAAISLRLRCYNNQTKEKPKRERRNKKATPRLERYGKTDERNADAFVFYAVRASDKETRKQGNEINKERGAARRGADPSERDVT
mmetsp:Transcript_570/g.1072  ORF Transcript_570/g.1072 Transcript_570/m.1072 type:complete len:158 (-) Transcript_570:9-482(-)